MVLLRLSSNVKTNLRFDFFCYYHILIPELQDNLPYNLHNSIPGEYCKTRKVVLFSQDLNVKNIKSNSSPASIFLFQVLKVMGIKNYLTRTI